MSKVLCLAALMVVLVVSSAQAQNVEMPQCVSELGPCGPFTNSTTVAPPTQCCQPLQNLIQNDLSCLCTVFANVELATTLMINVTEAATLPQRCNLQIDLLARCQALMGPSMAPSMGPSMVPSMAPSMSPERVPTPVVHAQDAEIPDCIHRLEPCGPFINSTTARPPTTCCMPLEDVTQNDLPCLCKNFGNIELIQTLNINVTEALTLPQRCGLQFEVMAQCHALSAPTDAPSMSPRIAATSGNTSGAGSTAWTGPIISGAFLVWATLMFY